MKKAELIQEIMKSDKLKGVDVSKKVVTAVVDALFSVLTDYFVQTTAKGKKKEKVNVRFSYPGFGTFEKKRRKAKKGRNPKTKEEITIPERYTITFTPSSKLKEMMNPTPKKK